MKNEIIQGDSLEVLKTFDDDCIDLIASDPPYQLGIQKPGVPSSTDQSERLKKGFMGKEWDILPQVSLLKECLRVLKPGAFSFWLMTPRQDSQSEFIIRLKQAGFNIGFTPLYWTYASGFPKAGNISKMVDKRMGAEREVVGKDNHFGKAGYSLGIGGQEWDLKPNPITPQAKALDGSYAGYQPKPAVEIIIVAMKPLSEKTYIDQALKNNKGITWLDDVRVPYESNDKSNDYGKYKGGTEYQANTQGRFPANLLVSDDVLGNKFSRYFNLDKLPKSVKETFPFMIVPKTSSGEKNDGIKGVEEKKMEYETTTRTNKETADKFGCERKAIAKNTHPTVKPTKLMEYLITLGSREGDLILDPFVGSGTTCISARGLSRDFIGIERDKTYHKIATARLKQHLEQTKLHEAQWRLS